MHTIVKTHRDEHDINSGEVWNVVFNHGESGGIAAVLAQFPDREGAAAYASFLNGGEYAAGPAEPKAVEKDEDDEPSAISAAAAKGKKKK